MKGKGFVLGLVFFGVVFGKYASLSSSEGEVPLKRISLSANIVDFLAEVSLNQEYENDLGVPLEAVYRFPIDEKCVIVDLVAEIDNRIIRAISKPKSQARREYQEAKTQGKTAYLMEESSNDVVTINIGNIPPGAKAKIFITYLTELGLEGDKLRFVVPTTIAPRYATPRQTRNIQNNDVGTNLVGSVPYSMSLSAHITMPSSVISVSSPSHNTALRSHEIEMLPNQANIFMEEISLDRDIIILIEQERPSESRIWLEEGRDSDTLMLTLYPSFASTENDLPLPFEKEHKTLTILLDTSGSMGGEKMKDAKKALDHLLSTLASEYPSVLFNVVTFSSSFQKFFTSLVDSSQANRAKELVKSLEAEGGTEILAPIQHIFSALHRSETYDHNLIVLTDGEVSYTPSLLSWVKEHNDNLVRIFTIGIGDAASAELVNGLASVGNGVAEFAVSGDENLGQKVSRQLSRALAPTLFLNSISWGCENLNFHTGEFPVPIYQKSRTKVFASIPKSCVINDPILHFGDKKVPIQVKRLSGDSLQKMAAKNKIRQLQLMTSPDKRVEIIALATKNNLLSSETSYVAVDVHSEVDSSELQTIFVPLQAQHTESSRKQIHNQQQAQYYPNSNQMGAVYSMRMAQESVPMQDQPSEFVIPSTPQGALDDVESNHVGSWIMYVMSDGGWVTPTFYLVILCTAMMFWIVPK